MPTFNSNILFYKPHVEWVNHLNKSTHVLQSPSQLAIGYQQLNDQEIDAKSLVKKESKELNSVSKLNVDEEVDRDKEEVANIEPDQRESISYLIPPEDSIYQFNCWPQSSI